MRSHPLLLLLVLSLAAGCAAAGGGEADETTAQRVRAPDAGSPPGPLVVLGAVDRGFGEAGIAALPHAGVEPRDLLVQPDGKIVIVGSLFVDPPGRFEGYVYRYLPSGALDPGFDGDGVVLLTGDGLGATSAALDARGKLVLGGNTGDRERPARVWRLEADGARDRGFGQDGELALPAEAAFIDHVAVAPDGAIHVLGMAFEEALYVTRLLEDGTVDPAYRAGPVVVKDFFLHAAAPLADGSWILAGAVDPFPHRAGEGRTIDLARLGPDGAQDTGFGDGGLVEVAADYVGTASTEGDRLLVGLVEDGRARVEARSLGGRLDPGFGDGGSTPLGRTTGVHRVLAAPDGTLVIAVGDSNRLSLHRAGADGAVVDPPWVSALPDSVIVDHVEVGLDPAGDDVFVAAVQHRRTPDANGTPWWLVTGTGLVRIPGR
jgi:uncharacterized delta-60 repeat protein